MSRKAKGVSFKIDDRSERARRRSRTDAQRLDQVLKNLLSNAFKFTERGYVNLRIAPATERLEPENATVSTAQTASWRFRSATAASASRRTSRRRSSSHSCRRTAAPAESTAALAWGWRSAASWRACSAARSEWKVRKAAGARSPCSCRKVIAAVAEREMARIAAGSRRTGSKHNGEDAAPSRRWSSRSPTIGRSSLPGRKSDPDHRGRSRFRAVAARCRPSTRIQRRGHAAGESRSGAWCARFAPSAITLDLSLPDVDGWQMLRPAEIRS